MKRMARNRSRAPRLNLTPLMDVFTTLVFFLVVNQGTTELLDAPKQITLPDSVVEDKPRETVVIFVSPEHITVQGEIVARVADVAALEGDIAPVAARLAKISGSVIGINTKTVAESEEVTVLADKAVPFHIVKKVLSTCTAEGYERISLAVTQKETETPLAARS
jgi:biopolymer transport protein ExbD